MTKREIAGTLAGLIAGSGGVLALPTATPVSIEKLAAQQQTTLSRTGKFEHVRGKNYTVHEYVTPKGERGFQIIYSDSVATYSVGYGPEAESRSWVRLNPPALTATST